ncbi:MAG: MBL fold metallo-hydrolase [Rhodospirillales bacterium]|nr:MBL fold metallo-hydrolase [Rhodospirillales bacterium]
MAEGTTQTTLSYPFETAPAPGATLEVASGVHWVRMPLPFPPDHINLWLLADGDGWIIVDSGLARDDTKAHWEQIFAATLGGKPVTRVVITHFHPDHMGLAAWLCQRWGVEAWMTAGEWYQARAVHALGAPADVAQKAEFYRANGVGGDLLGQYATPENFYRRGVPEIPPSFRRLRGGEAFSVGGRAWTPIIGRGHAPEHACLWCADLGVMIGGDILLPRISPNVSVWPAEPYANPLHDYLDSLSNFAHIPADALILPAHGLPYRGVHPRIAELRAHHAERLDRLANHLGKPLCGVDCFPLLLRRPIGPHNMGLALGEALAHLHHLERTGRVAREKDAHGVWRFAARR